MFSDKNTYISKLLKNWDIFVLSLLISIYILTFSTLSILRHSAFYTSYDLANMSQTVWNTLNGRPFSLSGAESSVSRFSIHADLILVFLSPFYLIWEKAKTLLIIQSVILGLGGIVVYGLAKRIIFGKVKIRWKSKLVALSLVVIYLLNPSLEWTNIYDFHGVSLAITFLLSAFYFCYIKKWFFYAFFIVLALLTKEEISLYVAMLGLVNFFVFKNRKVGLATFIGGVVWFCLMVFWVIPHNSPNGKYWALEWLKYSSGGTGTGLPDLKLLIDRFLLSPDTLSYYSILLKPFSYIALLGFPWLLLSLPELTINLLSTQAQMRSIYFHYDSGLTPSIIIATIFGLKYLTQIIKKIGFLSKFSDYVMYFVVFVMLCVALRVNYHYSPLPTTPSCWCYMYQVSDEDREIEKSLKKIPEDATVTSSSELRAHLSLRQYSYNLPSATESADYIAILNQNRIVGDNHMKPFEVELIKILLLSKKHILVDHTTHYFLFKRIKF